MGRRLRKGEILTGIPTDAWNRFDDAAQIVQRMTGRGNGSGVQSGASHYIDVDIVNETGEALTADFPILKLGDSKFTDAAKLKHTRPLFEGEKPKADKPFVVVQAPAPGADVRTAIVLGVAYCQVDIQDEADEVCGPVDDDTEKLKSGIGSTRIMWKEPGTGVKLAKVILGEGGAAPTTFDTGFAIVSQDIPPMVVGLDTSSDPPTGQVTWGEGIAYPLVPIGLNYLESEAAANWKDWEVGSVDQTAAEIAAEYSSKIILMNPTQSVVKKHKIVQWRRHGDYRFIMAEDCA